MTSQSSTQAAEQYEVVTYAADGHAGEVGAGRVIARGTLAECRGAVRGVLGVPLLSRRWDGVAEDGDVEAYHESDEEGCGGYAIRRAE